MILNNNSATTSSGGCCSYDDILEYDYTGDEIREVGNMEEERGYHAISVVQYSDYSHWCQ